MIGPKHEEKEDAQVVALNQEIGRRLREKREQLGLTQADAAARLGLKQGRYSQIERGSHDLRASNIVAVARILGMDPAELLRDL